MYHKSLKRNMGLSVLILVLVSLSIGYAIISSNLELNGNAKIANMAWQVYFDNVKVTDGSTGLSIPTLSADKTSVSFTTSFTKPTDYYDFTLDLINAGTIAAKVDSVVLSGLTAEQDVYANYRVTYVGGGEISAGDTLNPGETREIRVRLEMDPDVDGSLLPSTDATLALSARINFVQGEEVKYLMDVIKKEAVLDSIASTYVTSSSGIDFSAVSSDTNGKGVYTLTSSASDKYPIYYYRGAVENNNVIFGGFCWKMVRTTETGGIKLIYNGTPTDGTCVATGADTTIGTASMNAGYQERYMYSNPFIFEIGTSGDMNQDNGKIFGKSVTYANGFYTLEDTHTLLNTSTYGTQAMSKDGYRYTCSSATAISCSSVTYYNQVSGPSVSGISIILLGGLTIDDVIANFTYKSTNEADSAMKTSIDTWYKDQITNYSNSFEDTVWCVDSNIVNNGSSIGAGRWGTSSFDLSTYTRVKAKTPSLVCGNNSDQLTVYKENGNGDLTYPVAQITVDEAMLAGFSGESVTDNFLNTENTYFTLSPRNTDFVQVGPVFFGSTYVLNTAISFSASNTLRYSVTHGLRPMVSLKVGTTYTSGTGTSSDPYIIS